MLQAYRCWKAVSPCLKPWLFFTLKKGSCSKSALGHKVAIHCIWHKMVPKMQHQLQSPKCVHIKWWFPLGGLQTLRMQQQSVLVRLTKISKHIASESPKCTYRAGLPCSAEAPSRQRLKPAHCQRTVQLSLSCGAPQMCCWLFPRPVGRQWGEAMLRFPVLPLPGLAKTESSQSPVKQLWAT